jgi:hypothetical protein
MSAIQLNVRSGNNAGKQGSFVESIADKKPGKVRMICNINRKLGKGEETFVPRKS